MISAAVPRPTLRTSCGVSRSTLKLSPANQSRRLPLDGHLQVSFEHIGKLNAMMNVQPRTIARIEVVLDENYFLWSGTEQHVGVQVQRGRRGASATQVRQRSTEATAATNACIDCFLVPHPC